MWSMLSCALAKGVAGMLLASTRKYWLGNSNACAHPHFSCASIRSVPSCATSPLTIPQMSVYPFFSDMPGGAPEPTHPPSESGSNMGQELDTETHSPHSSRSLPNSHMEVDANTCGSNPSPQTTELDAFAAEATSYQAHQAVANQPLRPARVIRLPNGSVRDLSVSPPHLLVNRRAPPS